MAVTCTGATLGSLVATLNGQGQNVALDHTLGFSWGTALGGPYPNNTTHLQAGTNVAAQNYSVPIVGLDSEVTYYFVAREYDAGDVVVASSAECSFVALAVQPVFLSCSGPCTPNEAQPLPPVIAPPCATCEELQAA